MDICKCVMGSQWLVIAYSCASSRRIGIKTLVEAVVWNTWTGIYNIVFDFDRNKKAWNVSMMLTLVHDGSYIVFNKESIDSGGANTKNIILPNDLVVFILYL